MTAADAVHTTRLSSWHFRAAFDISDQQGNYTNLIRDIYDISES
jgi:hypothetical protein